MAMGPTARNSKVFASAQRFAAIFMGLLSRRVCIEVAATYTDLLATIGSNQAHFAWLPPAVFVHGQAEHGLRLLVGGIRENRATYRGTLFTRNNSTIQRSSDLQGAKVAWVDANSCAGYLFPRLALRDAGFDPDSLFGSQDFFGDHAAVARAVALGQADVGSTFIHEVTGEAGWSLEVDLDVMRPVLSTEVIPSDVIVAAPAVERTLAMEMTAYLSEIHSSAGGARTIAEVFGVERFEPVPLSAYERVAAAIRDEQRIARVVAPRELNSVLDR